MDIEHNHVGQFLSWVSEHWPIILFAMATGAGSAWYSLHRVFATKHSHVLLKSEMDACAARLQTDFHAALTGHEHREDQKIARREKHSDERHSAIHEDVKEIRQDVRQLMSKLIP